LGSWCILAAAAVVVVVVVVVVLLTCAASNKPGTVTQNWLILGLIFKLTNYNLVWVAIPGLVIRPVSGRPPTWRRVRHGQDNTTKLIPFSLYFV
jgi:hypothetical protein